MVTNIPSISSSQIRNRVGETSFPLSEAYFEGGAIQHTRINGMTILKICRESGLIHDLVDRLLKIGRATDAEVESAKANDYDLLGLANLVVAHDRPETAERMVRGRISVSQDSRLLEWLKDYLVKAGKQDEALTLAEKLFWQRPFTYGYEDIHQIAASLNQWDELRKRILNQLGGKNQFSLLTEIYLSDQAIYPALESYGRYQQSQKQVYSAWGGSSDLRVRLAEAAEASRPYESIRLYLIEAEHSIGQRNRGAYVEAAGYLARIKRNLGDTEPWKMVIARIRIEYKRLPALMDGLGKAKLV